MATYVSGAAAYCTGAQFCDRYDWRSVADLLADDGVRLANRAAVEASTTLASLLKQSSGVVEAAFLQGNRHTPADIAGLTGNMSEWLAGLVAGHAIMTVFERRPALLKEPPPSAVAALEAIARVARGENVLGIQSSMDSGNVKTERELASDVENRQMLTTTVGRMLGRRTNRIDPM